MKLHDISTQSRANNLNLIRLLAAISVTFGHSFAMLHPTGRHYEIGPGINSALFGFYAVAIFFMLSGFLILQSYNQSKSNISYILGRVFRIFPGLLFANIVTAILVGFFVLNQGWGFWTDSTHLVYIVKATRFNLSTYKDIFVTMPHNSPNGSLWTLPFEFRYYILVLIFGLLGLTKRKWLLVLAMLSVTASLFIPLPEPVDYFIRHTFKLSDLSATYVCIIICFAVGMLCYSFKENVNISLKLALGSLALFFLVDHWLLKILLLVYVVLVFGFHPKLYISRLNFKIDLSYGIYVLSWPVQQTLIFNKTVTQPENLFFVSMLIVLPLAIFSWIFFESPALKLKNRLTRRKQLH